MSVIIGIIIIGNIIISGSDKTVMPPTSQDTSSGNSPSTPEPPATVTNPLVGKWELDIEEMANRVYQWSFSSSVPIEQRAFVQENSKELAIDVVRKAGLDGLELHFYEEGTGTVLLAGNSTEVIWSSDGTQLIFSPVDDTDDARILPVCRVSGNHLTIATYDSAELVLRRISN